tara:strand:+ start:667 stop:1287 length:621 start_codon:yes stop_codon:yes gene_type:complete
VAYYLLSDGVDGRVEVAGADISGSDWAVRFRAFSNETVSSDYVQILFNDDSDLSPALRISGDGKVSARPSGLNPPFVEVATGQDFTALKDIELRRVSSVTTVYVNNVDYGIIGLENLSFGGLMNLFSAHRTSSSSFFSKAAIESFEIEVAGVVLHSWDAVDFTGTTWTDSVGTNDGTAYGGITKVFYGGGGFQAAWVRRQNRIIGA